MALFVWKNYSILFFISAKCSEFLGSLGHHQVLKDSAAWI
jgi:ribosomal protein L24E